MSDLLLGISPNHVMTSCVFFPMVVICFILYYLHYFHTIYKKANIALAAININHNDKSKEIYMYNVLYAKRLDLADPIITTAEKENTNALLGSVQLAYLNFSYM